MIPPLSLTIDTRARDVVLNDSCNCCCWRRPNSMRNVYISSSGRVSVFDPKKADDEREALRRTVSNLQKIIAEISIKNARDHESVVRHINEHIVELRTEEPPLITFDIVRDILGCLHKPIYRKRPPPH